MSNTIPDEIERTFLIDLSKIDLSTALDKLEIHQGYLSEEPSLCTRIRWQKSALSSSDLSAEGFLCVKGVTSADGTSRKEMESKIFAEDALNYLSMISSFGRTIVTKDRYLIRVGGHIWEVDFFKGVNSGLVVAEIELKSKEEKFELPAWVKKEVTGDKKYSNLSLSKRPFTNWADQ